MKGDMSGAASVLSAVSGIAGRQINTPVVALIPLCENMPGGNAIKPGDVLQAANGKTVEVKKKKIWKIWEKIFFFLTG